MLGSYWRRFYSHFWKELKSFPTEDRVIGGLAYLIATVVTLFINPLSVNLNSLVSASLPGVLFFIALTAVWKSVRAQRAAWSALQREVDDFVPLVTAVGSQPYRPRTPSAWTKYAPVSTTIFTLCAIFCSLIYKTLSNNVYGQVEAISLPSRAVRTLVAEVSRKAIESPTARNTTSANPVENLNDTTKMTQLERKTFQILIDGMRVDSHPHCADGEIAGDAWVKVPYIGGERTSIQAGGRIKSPVSVKIGAISRYRESFGSGTVQSIVSSINTIDGAVVVGGWKSGYCLADEAPCRDGTSARKGVHCVATLSGLPSGSISYFRREASALAYAVKEAIAPYVKVENLEYKPYPQTPRDPVVLLRRDVWQLTGVEVEVVL